MTIRRRLLSLSIALIASILVTPDTATAVCTQPSQLPKNSQGQFVISQTTTLCKTTFYGSFAITKSNITLDCAGATISGLPRDKMLSGIVMTNVDNVTIRSCIIDSFVGAGIRALRTDRKEDNALYDLNNPTSPAQPLEGIRLIGLKVTNNGRDTSHPAGAGGGGGLLRIKNSRIENSVFDNNYLGLYIEGDSHHNEFVYNTFSNSFAREGLILDSAHDNRVYGNKFLSNGWHGLSIYKNCGEDNSVWIRRYPADRNQIVNNLFSGHKGTISSVNSLRYRTGLAVGKRQGLALMKPPGTPAAEQNFAGCSDPDSHMSPWLRISKSIFDTVLAGTYLIRKDVDTSRANPMYIGPHNDLVSDTYIEGNRFLDNTIGLYVAADNTTLKGNRFYEYEAGLGYKQLNATDIYFGNRSRDRISKPILNLQLSGNLYEPKSPGAKLKASSIDALAQIKGDSVEKTKFFVVPIVEAQSLLELPSLTVPDGKPSYLGFYDL